MTMDDGCGNRAFGKRHADQPGATLQQILAGTGGGGKPVIQLVDRLAGIVADADGKLVVGQFDGNHMGTAQG